MAKEKVLVTGAAGFIAFHLIESLLRSGTPVTGIDNFDAFYERELKEKNIEDLRRIAQETGTAFELREADIRDFSFKDLPEVRSIIHLAAKAGVRPSIESPEEYTSVNVQGTTRVLEFARERKILEIVFGSSSSVYGNDTKPPFREESTAVLPISPYAATKRAGELLCATYCHLYGMKIAALRFFTVYGPRQRPDLAIHKFAKLIHRGESLTLFGDGSTSRDYTYVTDIVKGIRSSLEWVRKEAQSGQLEVFNLGGSKTTALIDLVRMLERELKAEPKIVWKEKQPGDVEITFADVSKSRKVLGYSPDFPIDMGIKKFVEWFRESN